MTFADAINAIHPVDRTLEPALQARLDNLAKPPGSLGRMEELALRYSLAAHTTAPEIGPKRICVFAGDHGATAEGVSAYPREITAAMARNMAAGGAAINAFAASCGAAVHVIDVGVDADFDDRHGIVARKIARGTANLAREPAMTREQTERALDAGAEMAGRSVENGGTLLAAGEMGIGNTTAAAALHAALLPAQPRRMVGRGAGLDGAGVARKTEFVEQALRRHGADPERPLHVLQHLGGFEIAALTGFMAAGAALRAPVLVDGFIASAAALVACRLRPDIRDYLIFSHHSAEAGHAAFIEKFEIRPLLDLDLRLGEGSGAALAIPLVEAAVRMFNEMATFDELGLGP